MSTASGHLAINEIFFSIQGEGDRTGWPCIFVRLAFCNLRCVWCDSTYTFYESRDMSMDEVMDSISGYPCRRVEVTGGEPLAQENVFPFMTRLCDAGYEVLLETSGSLDVGRVDPRVHRIVDVKCPGSGMSARNRLANLDLMTDRDEVKFVIRDRHDFEWARELVRSRRLRERCPVLFSPVWGELDNKDLAEWILDSGLDVRMQVQIHKYIWDPRQRGV